MKKYLLERFPLVWNTHLIWALPLILATHLFFFSWGFAMVTDEAMGNYYFSLRNRFEGLPTVMNFIAIVLLLVGWFIRLFRNNAFERFYPVSRWQLFRQFVIYLFIMGGILSSGLSFMVGENTKVHWRYTDSYIHNVLRQYPKNLNFENIERLPEAQQREYYIANNAKDIKEQLFIVGYEEEITMVATATFVLTLLLFAVRITSLRTVLLSIVCGGVLCLLLGLVLIFVLSSNIFGTQDVYVVLAILWLTYLSMIALSIFSDKKQYRGIAMNISLFGFLPMTIVTLIAIWERYDWWYPSLNIEEVYYYFWYNIKELIVSIGGILLSLVFIGLYTSVIKRWKAMPE
ncbi:hypothetical protein [Capnocytophaga sputigena]|uniref:hypothetical protein n=1 Tax=Capnocytophaga sputigena TaxID=1019 RepID=UPI0028D012AA|nr:hypothetical protein [Capnocytophaga sputigena]